MRLVSFSWIDRFIAIAVIAGMMSGCSSKGSRSSVGHLEFSFEEPRTLQADEQVVVDLSLISWGGFPVEFEKVEVSANQLNVRYLGRSSCSTDCLDRPFTDELEEETHRRRYPIKVIPQDFNSSDVDKPVVLSFLVTPTKLGQDLLASRCLAIDNVIFSVTKNRDPFSVLVTGPGGLPVARFRGLEPRNSDYIDCLR